ncbi:hypothetical protein AGMMS49975_29590 [Clostridia bacterium]|nr:hypothetical protein AGMMS49975_29590 [Clostridia bacterium]
MDLKKDLTSSRGAGTTFFHEHGHLIDFSNPKLVSVNQDFTTALIKQFMKSNSLKSKKEAYSRIGYELHDKGDITSSVSDIFGEFSKNKIIGGWRHEDSYWKHAPRLINAEVFAHFYEAQFDKDRLNVLKSYFPKSTQVFSNDLGGLL